jgi:acetyl coenzyme A synthetase (ADP forming)-like protein
MKNIKFLFYPKTIAVVGASAHPHKIGHVVFRNLAFGNFAGKVVPVNPKYEKLLGKKCYPSIVDVYGRVDLVVIATPAHIVPKILEDCGKKGVKAVVLLSGGFGEVGNHELEEKIKEIAKQHNIALLGPNCLGVYVPKQGLDTIFMPVYKSGRPKAGKIAFVTQSGAVGTAVLDWASECGIGISKFISYGNATVLTESEILSFLGKDEETNIICLYVEGVKDGRRFYKTLKEVAKRKVVIVLKAGIGEKGKAAAHSHTGNLAGNYIAYKAAFKQAKVIEAERLDDVFDFLRVFSQPLPKGKRVGIITNGGGMGVLTTDAIERHGLSLAKFSEKTREALKDALPSYANITNPLDLIADANVETYKSAISALMEDRNVDILVVDVLFQTPTVDETLIYVLKEAVMDRRKPVVVVSVGGRYTAEKRKIMECLGIPCFQDPYSAVRAITKLVEYAKIKRKLVV